jgi:beta-galactosidase/beta-glucuronidase
MASVPGRFESRLPVPGLVDEARPPFSEVGQKSPQREAFWYHRTFKVKGEVPAVALLKVHKAAYGSRVLLNGVLLGEHLPSFTPGYFDARPALRGNGAVNELTVRVGASREALPPTVASGWDFEKVRYIPGLFDSVELILSGTPNIVRVQVAPEIASQTIRVQAVVRNAGSKTSTQLRFKVREALSGSLAGEGLSEPIMLDANAEQTVEVRLPIRHCRLWSPEDPFLYELETSTGADTLRTRFGMREFRLDHVTGRAMLNGRPYLMRGSNVTLYRFFEDPQCADRPWREDWVRRLHRAFKGMHWNALRYCIGFPPESWYRIADEEGMLIQDEFPIWQGNQWPAQLKCDELIKEYTEWMQERWNHPCVVLWDAQNESVTGETGKAIQAVRVLDLSNRPWDNGYGEAQSPGDSFESHPYLFSNAKFKLSGLAHVSGVPNPLIS